MERKKNICRKCGKEFDEMPTLLCPLCYSADEEAYVKIRDYLREFPGSKIEQVTEATKVSTKLIRKFLRDERLEILDGAQCFLSCMSCGKPIRSGKYCDSCSNMSGNGSGSKSKSTYGADKRDDEMEIMLERAKMRYSTQKNQNKLNFKN